MSLCSESYECDGFDCDGFDCDGFDCDGFGGGAMGDCGRGFSAPFHQAGFILVGKLDPKTRMLIKLFAQGPPEGCDPGLN